MIYSRLIYSVLFFILTFTVACSGGGDSSTASPPITQESNDTNSTNDTNISFNDAFPSQYYPTKSHPRMWLSTQRLNDIGAQQSANTQRWQDFKTMCDSMIDNDSTNDPYGFAASPQNFTAPLALMYILTQNSTYADKALELMDNIDTNLSRYGDPDHQSWYFLALTYDWLYDYAGMSDARKTTYINTMHTLSDKFWTNYNLNASGTDSDQNLLTGMMHLAFGAALYGDDVNATTLLDRGWYGWHRGYYAQRGISNKEMIKAALGGVYFTGMAYFPSTDIIGIASYQMTLESACEYPFGTIESDIKDFWANTIYGIIALTEPNKEKISDYGSWQDPNILANQPWMRRAMIILEYFAHKEGNTTAASLAKGYDSAVDIGYTNDYFLELFFEKYDLNATNPYTANLPLVQFFDNPDFVLFRSSWEDNATWGEFRGDGSIPLDQQSPDHGHFSLYKNGSFLTKGARNYEALSHGDFFNTLSIENGCTLNGISCSGTAIFDSNKSAQITRHYEHNTQPLFSYAMLEADGQWNDNTSEYNPTSNVATYRRHFFHSGDYIVVFDRVRTHTPVNIRYRLRAMQRPTINGDTVTQQSQDSNATLLQKTLEPANVIIHELNETAQWSSVATWIVDASERHWQSYIDFNDTDTLNILNVLQMGDSNLSNFDTFEHITTSTYSGVHIGDWVVMLSSDEVLHNTINYTLHNTTTNMHHLVTDLEEGSYTLRVEDVTQGTLSVDTQSFSAYFVTDKNLSSMKIELIKN